MARDSSDEKCWFEKIGSAPWKLAPNWRLMSLSTPAPQPPIVYTRDWTTSLHRRQVLPLIKIYHRMLRNAEPSGVDSNCVQMPHIRKFTWIYIYIYIHSWCWKHRCRVHRWDAYKSIEANQKIGNISIEIFKNYVSR